MNFHFWCRAQQWEHQRARKQAVQIACTGLYIARPSLFDSGPKAHPPPSREFRDVSRVGEYSMYLLSNNAQADSLPPTQGWASALRARMIGRCECRNERIQSAQMRGPSPVTDQRPRATPDAPRSGPNAASSGTTTCSSKKETLRATSSSNLCARNVAPASTGASPTPHPCQAYSVLVSSCSHSSNENDAPAAPHPPTGSAAPPVPTACSVRCPTRPPSTRRTSAAAPCAAGVDEAIVPGVPCERLRIQPCKSVARGVTPPATVAPRGASRRVLDGRGPCAVQIRPPARPATGRSFDTSPPPAPPDTNRDGFCPLPGPSRASTSAARSPQRAPGKARPARCDAGRDPAPPRAREATPGWHCGHTLRAGMYLNLSGTPAGGGVAPSRLWPPPPRAGMEKGPKLMVSTPGTARPKVSRSE